LPTHKKIARGLIWLFVTLLLSHHNAVVNDVRRLIHLKHNYNLNMFRFKFVLPTTKSFA
jgi:hypothetical protein